MQNNAVSDSAVWRTTLCQTPQYAAAQDTIKSDFAIGRTPRIQLTHCGVRLKNSRRDNQEKIILGLNVPFTNDDYCIQAFKQCTSIV